ncbi:MAG: PilZ domain-containing protein [Planctomycetes bacterium]|nr:PilZ domain-containing protein [Planctomycetota bacterium]
MDEKRRSERHGVAGFDVKCRTLLGDGRAILGTVIDSSEGGARIEGPAKGIDVSDQVQVVFLYPSGEQVAHHATVCHIATEGNEFGVRFDSDPIPIIVHSQT